LGGEIQGAMHIRLIEPKRSHFVARQLPEGEPQKKGVINA
jgi:hypothetical protein